MRPPASTEGGQVRTDHRQEARLNIIISRVLVVGLMVAVALLVVGAVIAAARPDAPVIHSTRVEEIPAQLAAGEPGGFFQLGLIVLLATPFARVVALVVAYGVRRQWLFAGVSLIVAVLLVAGAALGLSLY